MKLLPSLIILLCGSCIAFLTPSVHHSARRTSQLLAASTENPPEDHEMGRGISSSELRMSQESRLSRQDAPSKFVIGDQLHSLRKYILGLKQELLSARRDSKTKRVAQLERSILKAQQVDAEFVYQVSLDRMKTAKLQGSFAQLEYYRQQALEARQALPQFQLEGLWVGKYADSFELINITYSGDHLIAYKVTGDKNVPKGKVTFAVDLSNSMEPIELGTEAVQQWNHQYLPRFAGQGQVASPGFANSQYMDGQLILVGDYFAFVWLPLGQQVFFGRPSPELTLKLLREARSTTHADGKLREHLTRCWEETEHLEDDREIDGLRQNYYDQPGCFE